MVRHDKKVHMNDHLAGSEDMSTINALMEIHHRAIIFSLAFIVIFFAASCTFHDIIPICHYVFGCDHHMHMAA
jgi:hypothetical protein